jgi:hypothetical protein
MTCPRFEAFLARLYVAKFRSEFLQNPRVVAAEFGLSSEEVAFAAAISPTDLQLAAESFARKRAGRHR